ncbi:hypothetical protein XMG48_000103 [Marinobacterium sp. xm-g-48]|uniref:hypothetical protein n=1 Tax=Marinobacterium sp. xm-g-48 TaxID=2497738 RepID=UPI001569E835|nr:hypothetical protein [Marinobacterium sp. xm-g-48]NRP09029.1 hypothetical protein [Marinobacterium sp. xm-g-48]
MSIYSMAGCFDKIDLRYKGDDFDVCPKNIPHDFVISRDEGGSVQSIFSDNSWIFSKNYSTNFHFDFDVEHDSDKESDLYKNLVLQVKAMMWFWLYSPEVIRADLKLKSVRKNRLGYLKRIASVCYACSTDLNNADQSPEFLARLKASIASGGLFQNKKSASVCITALHEFNGISKASDAATYGIKPLWGEHEDKVISNLLIGAKNQANDTLPTPLIPTRILGCLIDSGFQYIDEGFERLRVLRDVMVQKKIYGKGDSFSSLKRCQEYLESGLSLHWTQAISDLQNYHLVCAYLIHAFTGCRTSEVEVIPYEGCLIKQNIREYGEVYFLTTRTRKILQDNYSVPMQWVTTKELERVIRLARLVSEIKTYMLGLEFNPQLMPLLVGGSERNKNDHFNYPLFRPKIKEGVNTHIFEAFGCVISESDRVELREFDLFTFNKRDDKYAVGNVWPFNTHQFRRSLAVYASRSGMVSLPSLGSQYKHVSLVMTALYARRSSYATSFIPLSSKGEPVSEFGVVTDFQNGLVERDAVKFEEGVIKYASELKGPKGKGLQIQKDRNEIPVRFLDRESTQKAIKDKRNPLVYQNTPVGGCMRTELCGSFGIELITPCAQGCPDSIIHEEKLEAFVEGVNLALEYEDPASMTAKATRLALERIQIVNRS